MSATIPALAERELPGLSETLTGPRDPDHCTSCGVAGSVSFAVGPTGHASQLDESLVQLRTWVECDPWDKHTSASPVVILCPTCEKRKIDPHPRLYHALEPNEPRPGAMEICVLCKSRDGLRCTDPRAKANGGAGLSITVAHPTAAHICCSPRRNSRFLTIWPKPASACAGRHTMALAAEVHS